MVDQLPPDSVADRRPVRQVLRHAPRPVWILILGVFINRLGSYFSTFVVLFLTARGFSVGALPVVLVAIGVSGMVGAMAGGWLADTVGRKRSLIISMLTSTLALAALSMVTSPLAVVVAVCVVSLCTASYLPAASALLVDHTAPVDRVPIFAFFRVALNLGAAIGPLLAGLVASSSFDALFLVDGATCMVFAVLLLVGLRAQPRPERAPDIPQAGDRPRRPSMFTGRAWRSGLRPVVLLCLAVLGVAMVYAQHSSTLPLQLADRGYSPRFYGVLLAVNGFLVICFELPLSSLTRRYRWDRPMLAGALLITFGMGLSGLLPGVAAAVVAVGVWSFGEMLLTPVANTAVAALSPPDRIGRYQALLSTTQQVGFSLGPAIGILAYGRMPTLPWLACAAIGVAVAVLVRRAGRAAPESAGLPCGNVSAPASAGSKESVQLNELSPSISR